MPGVWLVIAAGDAGPGFEFAPLLPAKPPGFTVPPAPPPHFEPDAGVELTAPRGLAGPPLLSLDPSSEEPPPPAAAPPAALRAAPGPPNLLAIADACTLTHTNSKVQNPK
jgi:hypothetical protein